MGPPWEEHHGHRGPSYYPYHPPPVSIPPYESVQKPPWSSVTSSIVPWHHTFYTAPSKTPGSSMTSDNHTTSATPTSRPSSAPVMLSEHRLTDGALAAAIVVPIGVLLFGILLAYLFFRRRRANQQTPPPPPPPAVATVDLATKLDSFRRRRKSPPPVPQSHQHPPTEPPIVTSQQNNAYYTGLDTLSLDSRSYSGEYHSRSSEEPPPPYIRGSSPPPMSIVDDARARSPFHDPLAASAFGRRNLSSRSLTSTLYTEEASFHEAREARRSVGSAQLVDGMSQTSREGGRRASDPFSTPAVSTASLSGDEEHGSSS